MMKTDRHYGAFMIDAGFLEDARDLLLHDLFSKIIVTRAEYILHNDAISYIGYSPELFPAVPVNEAIPAYVPTFINGELEMVRIDE